MALARGKDRAPLPGPEDTALLSPALLAHLSAMFVAAFTPNHKGVAPATVAALGRLGVSPGRGIGVAVQLFVLDLTFFPWTVPLSLAYRAHSEAVALPPIRRWRPWARPP